ncbi:MAG: hypothetical protein KGL35_04805, partial [Bradyrhizobium sp.]|nr:hypothetical protein [Bradyrhizobium sp.]
RRSKLTLKQWAEVERRRLAGESDRALAREYKVAESTIRERFSAQHKNIKDVANQIVSTEKAFLSLPISAQISALSLADDLRAISMHLAGAAKYGAATAHRLAGIAHEAVQRIDDASPLDAASMEPLKVVAGLTRLANDAASTGLNLLAANKDTLKGQQERELKEQARRPAMPIEEYERLTRRLINDEI